MKPRISGPAKTFKSVSWIRSAVFAWALMISAAASCATKKPVDTSSTLVVNVIWVGDLPERPDYVVENDRVACAVSGKLPRPPLPISVATGAIQNAFVTLERRDQFDEPPSPTPSAAVAQVQDCVITPPRLLLADRGMLTVVNRGTWLESLTITLPESLPRSVDLATFGSRYSIPVTGEGQAMIQSRQHPWARCSVWVSQSGHNGVTNNSGTVTFSKLSAGSYTVRAYFDAEQDTPVLTNGLVTGYTRKPILKTYTNVMLGPGKTSIKMKLGLGGQ